VTREKDHFPLSAHDVEISNARLSGSPASLDVNGFILLQNSPATHSADLQEITRQHEQECRRLLTEQLGTTQLLLINSVIRRSEQSAGYLADGTTLPARFAHNDFGAGNIELARWVDRFSDIGAYESLKRRRIAAYNLWRVISEPPTDVPLALCDVASVNPRDRVGVEFHEQMPPETDWVFEMSAFQFNPAQHWCYFPDMHSGEVLVFKGFDSDTSRAQLTPHAAFTLNNTPESTRPRESIESRFLVVFED
jgi:hypothetical protein|tara:strand:- start:13526 stop:14278 length:753 start_codon:yes stop_codon:yes gene_type:complete